MSSPVCEGSLESHIGWDIAWKWVYKWETYVTLKACFVGLGLGAIQVQRQYSVLNTVKERKKEMKWYKFVVMMQLLC